MLPVAQFKCNFVAQIKCNFHRDFLSKYQIIRTSAFYRQSDGPKSNNDACNGIIIACRHLSCY